MAGAGGPDAGMSPPIASAVPEGAGRRRGPLEESPETVADEEPEVLATGPGTVHTLRRADGDRRVGWSAAWLEEGGSGRWGLSGEGIDAAATYSKGAARRRPAVEEATLEGQG